MIQEAYISFEVAKLLKEKGFNEKCEYCYAYFDYNDIRVFELSPNKNTQNLVENRYPCVTHQMAIAWLREEYGISIEISALNRHRWVYTIYRLLDERVAEVWNDGTYVSYEDATDDALKYCLENLNKFI